MEEDSDDFSVNQRPAKRSGEDDGLVASTREPVPEEYVENAKAIVQETLNGLLEHVDAFGEKTRETAERVKEAGVLNRATGRGLEGEEVVGLSGDSREEVRIEDLVRCENALLSKSTMILARLGEETQRLNRIAHETIYPMLATLGERPDDEESLSESELRRSFAEKLQPLQDTLLFMEQLRAVTCNLFSQLAVVSSTYTAYTPYQSVRLAWSFDTLGHALAIGLGIDETVRNNRSLGATLTSFKRAVLVLRAKPEQFGMSEVDVASLDSAIVIVEKQLFTCSFFASVLDQLTSTEQTDRFIKELAGAALELNEGAIARLNTKKELLNDKRTLLSTLCLTILHSRLILDIPDIKLCSKAWEVVKACVLVPVTTTVAICPETVLDMHLSPAARECVGNDMLASATSLRRETLANIDETFPAKLHDMVTKSVAWLSRFTAVPTVESSLSITMNSRVELFQQGIKLANGLRHYLQEVVHLHVSLDSPITKRRVRLISRGVELLQATHEALTRKVNLSVEIQHVLNFLADRIYRIMVRPG